MGLIDDWSFCSASAFICTRTVSELHLREPLGLLFERKQIPQFIANIRIRPKTMEPLEATRLPWAELRARVNIAEHH